MLDENERFKQSRPLKLALWRVLAFQMCIKPCCKNSKTEIAKQGRLYEKSKEKIEKALDLEQLRKDHKSLADMRFLLLDDPYVRKLLMLQKD
jgi:Tfp pilus assembly protein PilO